MDKCKITTHAVAINTVMENDILNVSNLMFVCLFVCSNVAYLIIAELLLKLFLFATCTFQHTQWGFRRDHTKILSSKSFIFNLNTFTDNKS